MSLEHAILGFLSYRPYTGYDLKRIFDSTVFHFWQADQSQIYRTLARLTERGLAGMEKVPQEDRPDRKIHSITPAGRAELIKWLSGPAPTAVPRNAGLIQVFFAGRLSDHQILAKLEEYAAHLRGLLRRYSQIPAQLEPFRREVPSPREQFFWMLTLDNGIRSMRANLEWAEQAIARIRSGQVPPETPQDNGEKP
jgi:PadR family transcriptional regulator AphA